MSPDWEKVSTSYVSGLREDTSFIFSIIKKKGDYLITVVIYSVVNQNKIK